MITFDDIPEAESHTPLDDDPNKPVIGELINGSPITLVKAVNMSTMVKYSMDSQPVESNLTFKSHSTRPSIIRMAETDQR